MESKINYTVVGLFVLLLSAALIAGILWLGTGKQYRKNYDTYLAYFGESVSGLNRNAPVKYRGVAVGVVRQIAIDPANPERVRLELGIERGTPIKEDTVAVLKVQGLTGIAYVELSGGSRDAAPLKPKPGSEYPVITTGPSLLARLDTAVTDLLSNLDRTTERVNVLLDEENRLAFKTTLADIAAVAHTLAKNRGTLDAGMADAAKTMENSARASAELPQLLERIGRSADALEKMATEAARASASARTTVENVGQRLSAESLPEAERLLNELRELTASARRVSEQLEQNPAALLRGRQASPPGPGE